MTAELSARELEVSRLVALGWRNRQIAAELGIVEVTVKNHLQRIFTKLEIDNRTQLALFIRSAD